MCLFRPVHPPSKITTTRNTNSHARRGSRVRKRWSPHPTLPGKRDPEGTTLVALPQILRRPPLYPGCEPQVGPDGGLSKTRAGIFPDWPSAWDIQEPRITEAHWTLSIPLHQLRASFARGRADYPGARAAHGALGMTISIHPLMFSKWPTQGLSARRLILLHFQM